MFEPPEAKFVSPEHIILENVNLNMKSKNLLLAFRKFVQIIFGNFQNNHDRIVHC